MGRTRRQRSRKTKNTCHSDNIINLIKFMGQHQWDNKQKLKLWEFPDTGRGVYSEKNLNKNDTIISIPINLMVTIRTLHSNNYFKLFKPNSKLAISDYLTVFLVVEKHKGKTSEWKFYIDSLPSEIPLLPWLSNEDHIKQFPNQFSNYALESYRKFEQSWLKLSKVLRNESFCNCCGKTYTTLMHKKEFIWAYILVNSRAVYINPNIFKDLNNVKSYLIDEPSIALCPFLDMFNHSNNAQTKVHLKNSDNGICYQLVTLTAYPKFEQIFISYGPHSNLKLLMEYGFIIPNNQFDTIAFDYNEILDYFQITPNLNQQKFIYNQKLNISTDLFIDLSGRLSFDLKILLFVITNPTISDYNYVIYSGQYVDLLDLIFFNEFRKLIKYKIEMLKQDIINLNNLPKLKQLEMVLLLISHHINLLDIILNKLDLNEVNL